MSEARRTYKLSVLEISQLNFILSLIADRLDELEGRRGTPLFKNHIDMSLNRITNAGDAVADTDVPTKKQAVIKAVDAAVSVEPEQTFGLSTAVGTSNKYARQDHSHGSPAAPSVPSASGTVTAETTFGLSSNAGTAATFSKGDHTHGSPSDLVQRENVTSQFDKTNDAALANVTGLSITLEASKTYIFRALLFVDADAVGGHKYAVSGTATASAIKYQLNSISNAANIFVINSRQTALGGAGVGQAGATGVFTEIWGLITTSGAGTLTIQFAQNAATPATTSSVLVGSYMAVEEVV